MEKYMKSTDVIPNDGEFVLLFSNNRGTKMIKMDPIGWTCAKQLYTKWCYVNEVVKDIVNLNKYVRGFNFYREEVKKLAETSTDSDKLLNIVEQAAEIIKG